jgi:multidrug resistance efflux pump
MRQDIEFDAIREAASLGQRIPVRIPTYKAPSSVVLAAGMTAAVQIDDARRSPTK